MLKSRTGTILKKTGFGTKTFGNPGTETGLEP